MSARSIYQPQAVFVPTRIGYPFTGADRYTSTAPAIGDDNPTQSGQLHAKQMDPKSQPYTRDSGPLHSLTVSILVVQLVREGLLFGADRNITTSLRRGPDVLVSGQSQRPKVLRWPNRQVLIGYVGRARVAGQPADEWLYDFIGRNLDPNLSLSGLPKTSRAILNATWVPKSAMNL